MRWVVQAVHRNRYTRRYRCRDGIRVLAARLEGVILLDDVRRIVAEDRAFVEGVCLQVGIQLHNVQLFEKTQAHRDEMVALHAQKLVVERVQDVSAKCDELMRFSKSYLDELRSE